MKRIKIVGLCLAAVFAFSALFASTALAKKTPPPPAKAEYGQCIKETGKKHKGGFEDSNCTKAAPGKKPKGAFRFAPGPSPKNKFTSKTGTATLETPAFGGAVVCTTSKGTGEITGAKTVGNVVVTFENCETAGKKCNSAGPNSENPQAPGSGLITTNKLKGNLVGHGEKGAGGKSEEPASGQTWTDLLGEKTAFSSEFDCEGGLEFSTTGNVAGVNSPNNVASKTSTQTFQKTGPEQNLLTNLFISGNHAGGPAPSTEETTAAIEYEEADEEIKAP